MRVPKLVLGPQVLGPDTESPNVFWDSTFGSSVFQQYFRSPLLLRERGRGEGKYRRISASYLEKGQYLWKHSN